MVVGSRVMVKNRNNVTGTIRSVQRFGNIEFFQIMLDSGLSITEPVSNLAPEIFIESPLDLLRQGNFQPKSVYAVVSTMNKLKGGHTNIIATLKSSRTEFYPYQFKPLLKFLNSPSRKILIADEVGLGKTIEAGYILTEMALRDLVKNCLVVCKGTLKQKWLDEMKPKFGFDFKIYNRKELMRAIKEDLESGTKSLFGIINYDYRETQSDEIVQLFTENNYSLDLLIVDEAHMLRNEGTIKHKAIKKIMNQAEYCIFMTATPIMTSTDNLYNLVKLIEPNYEEYSLFNDHLALSRPFIEASKLLNHSQAPKVIFETLKNKKIELRISLKDGGYEYTDETTVGERFKEDAVYIEAGKLAVKEPFDELDFVKLQFFLSELNSFHPIISRTRKREVQNAVQQVVRDVRLKPIQFSPQETNIYESIIDDYDGHVLALVQRKREASSCLPAFLEKYSVYRDQYEEIVINDAKFLEFENIVNQVVSHEQKKLIVFSFFKGTLDYLQKRLEYNNVNCFRIDGDVPIEKRQTILQEFKSIGSAGVLLSSEVGGEGLDMQFCDHLVNYDLPWNPMVVEQRIGRIDRVGQKSKIIHVYNLYLLGTIEEVIVTRLFARIHNFEQSLGLLEDILSTDESLFEDNNNLDLLERKIYGSKLTREAAEKLINDAVRAAEYAMFMRNKIEKELDNSFVSDVFVDEEIRAMAKQKRYITPTDTKQLLGFLFQNRLATLRSDFDSPHPYIRWASGDTSLFDFIENNLPSRAESPYLYGSFLSFKKANRKKEQIQCTFNQEEAFENKELEFLAATHPIVQAALHYFRSQKMDINKAFAFQAGRGMESVEGALYVVANYQFEMKKKTISGDLVSYFDIPLVFHYSAEGFSLLEESKAKFFLEADIEDYINHPSPPASEECAKLVELLMPILGFSVLEKRKTIEDEEKKLHISRQYRLIDTEVDFLRRKIEKDQQQLAKSETQIRRILESRIDVNRRKIDGLEKAKDNVDLTVSESLQSLTLIDVI